MDWAFCSRTCMFSPSMGQPGALTQAGNMELCERANPPWTHTDPSTSRKMKDTKKAGGPYHHLPMGMAVRKGEGLVSLLSIQALQSRS